MSKNYEERLKDQLKALAPSEEMIKMQKSFVDSEYMKNLHKQMTLAMKQMQSIVAPHPETLKRWQELAESLAVPQVFRFPEEMKYDNQDEKQIIESAEVIRNSDSKQKEKLDAVEKVVKVVTKNPSRETIEIIEKLVPILEDDLPYRKKRDYINLLP